MEKVSCPANGGYPDFAGRGIFLPGLGIVGELPSGIAAAMARKSAGAGQEACELDSEKMTHRLFVFQFGKLLEKTIVMLYICFEIVNFRWSETKGKGHLPAQSFISS
jgi:hypothetical protein